MLNIWLVWVLRNWCDMAMNYPPKNQVDFAFWQLELAIERSLDDLVNQFGDFVTRDSIKKDLKHQVAKKEGLKGPKTTQLRY